MAHLGSMAIPAPTTDLSRFGGPLDPARPVVMIVRDYGKDNELLDTICAFLDVGVVHTGGDDRLDIVLLTVRPAAVIADLEGETQDGFHVMKTAAKYDRSLPLLLLSDGDPVLLGALDAVREISGLTHVASVTGAEDIGSMVDFLCHAVRDAGTPGLMRT